MSRVEDEEKLNAWPIVGDVVEYWRLTGEDSDTVDAYIGQITARQMDTSSGNVVYMIDNRYIVPQKNIIGLSWNYYSKPLALCRVKKQTQDIPGIKKVIFNPPATIVLWTDGTKTVVKAAEGDEYSKWAGLALCMAKKQLGEDFHKVFKKWCKDEEEEKEEEFDGYGNPFLDALYRSFLDLNGRPYSDTGTARSCNCANSYLKKEKEKNEKGE